MTDLPMDHSIDVHSTNGASGVSISEDSAADSGDRSENGDPLSADVDVLSNTLNVLAEETYSNITIRHLQVKAIVHRENHVEASTSETVNRSNVSTSAAETWNMSGSSTPTDTAGCRNDCAVQAEYDNDRYVITNHVSHEYYYCQFCGFHTDTMTVHSVV